MCAVPARPLALMILMTLLPWGAMHAHESNPITQAETSYTEPALPVASGTSAASASTDPGEKSASRSLPADYSGRDIDAEWRKEAADRIEEHRKAELTILVTDAEGKPIDEADVGIKLKQHSFRFGTVLSVEFPPDQPGPTVSPESKKPAKESESGQSVAVPAQKLNAEIPAGTRFSEDDRSTYREKLFELFNTASPRDKAAASNDQMTAWLRSRGFLSDFEPAQVQTVPASYTVNDLKPPEELMTDVMKLQKETKLPIAVRRYSLAVDPANSEELQLQADYTRDFLTVMFSIPEVREVSIDGFWAPVCEVKGWALFGKDWSMRPVGRIYAELVKRVWSTNEEALTDAAGKVKIRGFIGVYRISVAVGSRTKTVTAVLPENGAEIRIQLD